MLQLKCMMLSGHEALASIMDQRDSSRLPRLAFDGDERKYKRQETKMLGHLHLFLYLKNTVQREPVTRDKIVVDEKENGDTYTEMILLLDFNSFTLIMRNVPNDEKKTSDTIESVLCQKRKSSDNQPVHNASNFVLRVWDGGTNIQKRGLMVDKGATSHIINSVTKFTGFDNTILPEKHRLSWQMEAATKKGTAKDFP